MQYVIVDFEIVVFVGSPILGGQKHVYYLIVIKTQHASISGAKSCRTTVQDTEYLKRIFIGCVIPPLAAEVSARNLGKTFFQFFTLPHSAHKNV